MRNIGGFPGIIPAAAENMQLYGKLGVPAYVDNNSIPRVGVPAFSSGDYMLSCAYYSGADYTFTGQRMRIGALETTDGPSFTYNGPALSNTVTGAVGWQNIDGNIAANFTTILLESFYAANDFTYNTLPDTLYNGNSHDTIAIFNNNFLGYHNSTYTTGGMFAGTIFGAFDIFEFDNPALNTLAANSSNFLNFATMGGGYGMILNNGSNPAINVLVSLDFRHYITIDFDLSDVIAAGYASANGVSWYMDAYGTMWVATEQNNVFLKSGNYYAIPLYGDFLENIPSASYAVKLQSALTRFCCPTGDGHR